MRSKVLFFLIVAVCLVACSPNKPLVVYSNESSAYGLDFIETAYSANADSLFHRFNVVNKNTHNKELIGDIKPTEIETVSNDKNVTVEGIRRMPLSLGVIPENMVVSLLVDRSVHNEDMFDFKNAVRTIIDNLPANTIYISFFDNQLRDTKRITAENFDLFEDEFSITNNNKIIFDAALSKFQELRGLGERNISGEFAAKVSDENIKKVLVILSDGRVDANSFRTADYIQRFSDAVQQLDDDPANKHRIEIHSIRYGERNDDLDFTLSYLCVDIRNENVRGGSYFANPFAFIDNLKESDNSIPDYELVMLNPQGKIYHGQTYHTALKISKNGMTIAGEVRYVVGSLLTPLKSGSNIILNIVFGLIAGLLLIGFAFLFMQLGIPYFRFKFENFNNKYVRRYSFDDDSVLKCHYCLREIRDGEEIITKCHHTVHKHCWIENGCKCTEYGRNCKHGKQFLYDSSQPFSSTHRPYFTNWALHGMVGGLASWVVFYVCLGFLPVVFGGLTKWLLLVFGDNKDFGDFGAFYLKIGAMLFIGVLLGFVLVLIFSHLNKYRQRKKDSVAVILVRSFVGAAFAFIAFLFGSVIIILCKADATNIFIDWLPWLLSGCAMGAVLFFRTNTVIKQIIPGVALSGIICFVILLTGGLFGIYAVVFALMAFGSGVGISFISARKMIHRYFLKFKGETEETIAIHKWMSVAGGSNDVSIGSSPDATIRMTWDNHPSIKEIHVRLFFDKKNRLPCIRILSNDVTYNGVFAKNNEEYLLKNDVKFTIGSTVFQYVES